MVQNNRGLRGWVGVGDLGSGEENATDGLKKKAKRGKKDTEKGVRMMNRREERYIRIFSIPLRRKG